jgi:hypothetical protein
MILLFAQLDLFESTLICLANMPDRKGRRGQFVFMGARHQHFGVGHKPGISELRSILMAAKFSATFNNLTFE